MSENAEFDEILEVLAETAEYREEYRRQVMRGLLYGFQGRGRHIRAKDELMRRIYPVGTPRPDSRTELPQKVCNYGKSGVAWYGSRPLDAIKNITGRRDGQMSMHWAVTGDTVEEYDPLKGKRFIGISEPEAQHWNDVDNSFLKKLTGEEWVETRTLNSKSSEWKPQGEIFIGGSKPLKINEKSKEQIERVKGIEYPGA